MHCLAPLTGRCLPGVPSPSRPSFDGASLADYRLVTRRRDLPPPLAPANSRGWLVRPDGYVATAAGRGDWAEIDDYLGRLVAGRGKVC